MTSNVGSELLRTADIGFNKVEKTKEENKIDFEKRIKSILKDSFKPEFLNRVDEIIIFSNLNKKDIKEIVGNMLKDVQERLDEHKIKLKVNVKARDYLVEKGFDEEYGARPLRRLIQKEIENALSSMIISGDLVDGADVVVGIKENALDIKVTEKAKVKS